MGMRSDKWGKPLWFACFMMAFNYKDHPADNKRQIYINYFNNLGDILPCVYCRDYYSDCMVKLPLGDFLDDHSVEHPVMLWLYLIKDLVNKKLIKQETECYEKEALVIDKDVSLTPRAKTIRKNKLKKQLFYTQESPEYDDVVAYYATFKSSCDSDVNNMNRRLQSCRHIPAVNKKLKTLE